MDLFVLRGEQQGGRVYVIRGRGVFVDEGFVEGGGDISIGKVYSIFSASIYIRKLFERIPGSSR